MGKVKTHRGAAKRFNLTKSGKVKKTHAFRRHILTKKSTKRKRALRQDLYPVKRSLAHIICGKLEV